MQFPIWKPELGLGRTLLCKEIKRDVLPSAVGQLHYRLVYSSLAFAINYDISLPDQLSLAWSPFPSVSGRAPGSRMAEVPVNSGALTGGQIPPTTNDKVNRPRNVYYRGQPSRLFCIYRLALNNTNRIDVSYAVVVSFR